MTLVWGIRQSGPADKVKRAGYLFQQLAQNDAQVIVPSVVVAEFITPIPTEVERTRAVAAISERFRIEPFDAQDAILAVRLWNEGKNRLKGIKGSRVSLRADAFIVATAFNHGALEFFTEDDDCFKMASSIMQARRLPTIAPSLFEGAGGEWALGGREGQSERASHPEENLPLWTDGRPSRHKSGHLTGANA